MSDVCIMQSLVYAYEVQGKKGRTAVASRATLPVKSSAPHTITNSSPKGRPLNPAVKPRHGFERKNRTEREVDIVNSVTNHG